MHTEKGKKNFIKRIVKLRLMEMKRLTVTLDEDAINKLEELAKRESRSLSEIVRSAISCYYSLSFSDFSNTEYLAEFLDLVASREHVVVDSGLWTAMLDVINDAAGEDFWKIVKAVGVEYGLQYKESSKLKPKEILKHLEVENWFKVKTISENTFTVVLNMRAASKLALKFLEGLFEALGLETEMHEGLRKIIIKIKDDTRKSSVKEH